MSTELFNSPAAMIVIPPAGIPRPKFNFPFSSMNATEPIIKADIPQTI